MQFTDILLTSSLSVSEYWGVGVIFMLLAYFFGAIPFGYIAGKMNGVDLREHGSGNIGATNAVRVLGKKWGLPVFVLDFLKGFFPVWLASRFFPEGASLDTRAILIVLVGMSAVLGHTYTCWLKFKGGKGVATAAGVVVALVPGPAGLVILTWGLVFLGSRYVSLASVVASAVFPLLVLVQLGYFSAGKAEAGSIPYVIFSFVIALLVVLKHIPNMKRLMAGTESRAFSKKN